MKGSRAEWLVLAALLVFLVGASILVGSQDELEGPERFPDPSTYNARGSGSKGLFVWLQELGTDVRRWERPLDDLPEGARVLLVLGPRRPPEANELNAVERWVRAGGILLLADSGVGRAVPGVLPGPAALKFGLAPRFAGGPATLRPAFPSRYVEGVETIQPAVRVRFQRQRPEGWAPLFADAAGDVVGVRRVGHGTVIAVADAGLFSNARLEMAGHARLALNIVRAHAGRGLVLVDEFHHGHGGQSAFLRYLKGTSAPWLLAQAGLVFLALLVARGTRFGPPLPSRQEVRASSLEYVGALGDLFRRAGARRLAAEALAGSLRRRLVAALGTRPGEDTGRLAARAAPRLGMPESVVVRCLAPAASASDEELLQYARGVHAVERTLERHRGGGSEGRGRGAGTGTGSGTGTGTGRGAGSNTSVERSASSVKRPASRV
jgi:hypothetical protein